MNQYLVVLPIKIHPTAFQNPIDIRSKSFVIPVARSYTLFTIALTV